jgi:hypothetical protein
MHHQSVRNARSVLSGKWTLLGHQFDLSGDVDWHKDPRSQYRWPAVFYSDLPLYELPAGVDVKYVWELGRQLNDGFKVLAKEFGVDRFMRTSGLAPRTVISFFDDSGRESLLVKSLFQQECLKRGVLFSGGQNICFSHSSADIEQTLRVYRSAMIAELWNTVATGKETTLEQRTRCRLAAVYAADNAREAMDLMYRHGGSTSFQRESRLAECWRDLHVVGQTVTIAPEWYPIGGRVYLGMDPGPRLR